MLDLRALLDYSLEMPPGAHIVTRSRKALDCDCVQHDVPSRPFRDCAHFGCAGEIAANSSYVRTATMMGEAVCVPCALARWGATPEEAGTERVQYAARARQAIAAVPLTRLRDVQR